MKNKKKKAKGAAQPVRTRRGLTKLDWSILLTAGVLVLEKLPRGVMMRFADESQYYIKYWSYFDSLPFGYGLFFPLITAVLTVVLALLLVGSRLLGKDKLREAAVGLCGLTLGTSLTALFTAIRLYRITLIACVIPAALLGLFLLLQKSKAE